MPKSTTPEKKPRVLPKYSIELVTKICEEVSAGTRLQLVLREGKSKGYPAFPCFQRWLDAHEDARKLYETARRHRAEALADSIEELADEEPRMIESVVETAKGSSRMTTAVDGGWVRYQNMRIETRKWLASKISPNRYGDRVAHAGVEGQPLQLVISKDDDGL